MLEHAVAATTLLGRRTLDEFSADRDNTFAVLYALQVVGEAARGVSAELKSSYPEVPWRQVIGTRDRIVHGYQRVDLTLVWQIVRIQLPLLIEQVRAVLEEES